MGWLRMATALMLLGVAAGAAGGAAAEDKVKVGMIGTFSGGFASWGPQFQRGAALYMAEHGDQVGGVRIELLTRDDGGPNPEVAKRLAQELLVRDKVAFLAGMVFTPTAMAIAPLATEARTPLLVWNAAASVITRRSPYIVRTSTTLWQLTVPLADWAFKSGIKDVYVAVSDYAPGHDARDAFNRSFTNAGGKIAGEILVPLQTTDFTPYLQRIKDARPSAVYVFMPAGPSSIGFVKTFASLGMGAAGIRLIGTGETDELDLPAIGDAALGMVTAYYYSPCLDTPRNRAWVAAYRRQFGSDAIPNFASVAAYDGMHLVYQVVQKLGAKVDGDRAIALMKGMTIDSPRGEMTIDPEERDVIQTVYIRRVEKVGDRLCNVAFDRYPDQKDLWKVLNK